MVHFVHIRMSIMEGGKEGRIEGKREGKTERQTDGCRDTQAYRGETEIRTERENFPEFSFSFFSWTSKIYLQTAQYNLSQLQCKAI